LNYSNPKVFDAINDISKMIHEVDGRHPTTTALSFSFKQKLLDHVKERMPDLDIISVQKYADVVNLPKYIDQAGIDRPYLVTEWGPVGHWEVEKTAWGAPIEPTSSDKAAHYRKNFEAVIEAHSDRILGSYAFKWGQKQERTPTWYGMFLEDGSVTEAVDVMHHAWTGDWPQNRSPRLEELYLDNRIAEDSIELKPAGRHVARAIAADPDGDPLTWRWVLRRESDATQVGGDPEEVPELIRGRLVAAADGTGTPATRMSRSWCSKHVPPANNKITGIEDDRSLLERITHQAGNGRRHGRHRAARWRALLPDSQLPCDAAIPGFTGQRHGALDVRLERRGADLRAQKSGSRPVSLRHRRQGPRQPCHHRPADSSAGRGRGQNPPVGAVLGQPLRLQAGA
jgi:hypothetical protein